ncbi:PLP-dependent aminotransferase family protein [Kaistia algarum]|uniref:aminotransferase-like domain-containing protein n=1 Tax=Kaistia algarum TaxID=2083279 RepID=UPI000CE8B0B2|nr:PLP-dependent aminotransferase family protein [Kaistia algarum]MCX5513598.1 PLP-dependent aminotransferase family protein [Kaistia algarum]PPE79517.1 PLP-dependent aminotransferase family protein [Kaistia algarum]
MWQPRIQKSAPSKFMGLVAAIAEDIAAGLITEGERMPPQRGVADALGIDLTTVTRAYREAKTRGLLSARPGRGGTWVAGNADTLARRAGESPVDLSLNIPPQPARADLPARIGRAMADILRAGTASPLQYVPSIGSEADRAAGAAWLLEAFGPDLSDRIAVTNGAQAALHAVCATLLRPGDGLCAGASTYPGVKDVAAQIGISLIGLAMDREGILPDAFETACERHRPKAIYVVPTIDNPTTATMPTSRREAIVAVARRFDIIIVEDDPYRPLADGAPAPIATIGPERSYHIATLSKCATPGLRIAYLAAPSASALIGPGEVLRATALMASPLMAAVASRWISDGTLHRITAALTEEAAARQLLAARYLAAADYRADANGYHLWLTMRDGWTSSAFAAAAGTGGVAVVPGAAFAIGHDGAGAVRVSLGAAPDRTALASGLRRLRDLLSGPPA